MVPPLAADFNTIWRRGSLWSRPGPDFQPKYLGWLSGDTSVPARQNRGMFVRKFSLHLFELIRIASYFHYSIFKDTLLRPARSAGRVKESCSKSHVNFWEY